ncbi:hypothetical protein QUA41_19075 [Microcoleus sp. Pol11C1]
MKEEESSATSNVQDVTDVTDVRKKEEGRKSMVSGFFCNLKSQI